MSKPITGNFRINHMDMWEQDFVDAEVEGYVRFDADGYGEFQFGYVHGNMTCEQTERNGLPAVEWSWEGNDEMDPAIGRGWAVLQEDGSLKGKLFFHRGDESGFTAVKKLGAKQMTGLKVKAIDARTGKKIEIAIGKIKPGQIRHPSIPDALLKRIRAIHTALKGAYEVPLEQMEINFMRDAHPEREVEIWERIVVGLAKASKAMPKLERKMILGTLLAHSMGALPPADLANSDVKRIIRIAEGK